MQSVRRIMRITAVMIAGACFEHFVTTQCLNVNPLQVHVLLVRGISMQVNWTLANQTGLAQNTAESLTELVVRGTYSVCVCYLLLVDPAPLLLFCRLCIGDVSHTVLSYVDCQRENAFAFDPFLVGR